MYGVPSSAATLEKVSILSGPWTVHEYEYILHNLYARPSNHLLEKTSSSSLNSWLAPHRWEEDFVNITVLFARLNHVSQA
jgi:hypothetical protein